MAGALLLVGCAVASNFTSLTGPSEGAVAEYAVAEPAPVAINSYSMPAAAGTLALNGQVATFAIEGIAAGGSFALSGQAAGISQPVAFGSFSISGQAARGGLSATSSVGMFALSGGPADLAQAVDAGSFSVGGYDTLGTQGVSAGLGSFLLYGRAFSATYGHQFGPTEGAVAEFAVTEFPRLDNFGVAASAGQFAISGQPALFTASEVAEFGSFAIIGGPADIAQPVDAGSFAISGQGIALVPAIAAAEGSFALSGGVAGIAWPVQHGAFSITGQAAFSTAISAGYGSFNLSGYAAANLPLDVGSFAINGQAALSDTLIAAGLGSFAFTGQNATLTLIYNFPVAHGAFALSGQEAGEFYTFRPEAGLFALTGYASFVVYQPVNHGSFALTGYEAGVLRTIRADVGRFDIVGWAITDATGPTGDHIFLIEVQGHDGSSLQTFYLGTEDYRSLPLDFPANRKFESRVRDPGNFERNLFSSGATRGKSSVGAGDIEVLSGDPGNGVVLDDWLTYGFDGRTISIKAQPTNQKSLTAAVTLFKGRLENIDSTNPLEVFNLKIADRLADLNQPLLTERFAGTTLATGDSAEGNADLKAQIKQQAWGQTPNVKLQPANVYDLIYLATYVGAFTTVVSIDVYDGGAALINDGDEASLADLRAASISPGHYRTCLAEGLVRLGGAPVLTVTADIVEGATDADRTAAQIVYRMLRQYGIPSAEIITGSFSALDTKNSAECQILVSDDTAAIDVMQQVLDSIGGWMVPNRDMSFEVGRFDAPVAAPALSFDLEIQAAQSSLDLVMNGVPHKQINVQYGRVWHVQPDSEITGSVSVERRTYLANQYRSVSSEDAAVATKHLKATELTVQTCLVYEADAEDEADRLLDLHKVERQLYNVTFTLSDAWAAEPGQALTLFHPRLAMASGKPFNVIGRIDQYAKEQVVVKLWG